MKCLMATLLLVSVASSAFAEPILVSTKLQLGDSTRLYNSLLKLGHKVEPNPEDPAMTFHKTGFQSADGSWEVQCLKKIRAIDLGTECEIKVDSSLAKNNSTVIWIGAFADALAIKVLNRQDIQALKKSIASPLDYFSSTEQTQVTLPNGTKTPHPLLKIDCKSYNTCQVTLLPRE